MTRPPRDPEQPRGSPQPNTDRDATIARLERALAEAREQLRRISIERDELRQQLARIDGMQTATVTLPNEPTSQERQAPAALPSIESRLHARLVSTDAGVIIEDFESKNGIKINSKLTNRQTLRHGDLLNLGGLRFRFLDAAADDAG